MWHLSHAFRDTLGYLSQLAHEGPFATIRPGRTYLVNDPDYIQHVLQENHQNYRKGERYRRAMWPLVGNGLPNSEGDFWKRQRRMIQPAFLRKHHEKYAAAIVDRSESVIASWRRKAAAGTPIDVRPEVMHLTLGSLLRTVFGCDADADVGPVGDAFLTIQHQINLVDAFSPVRLPESVPTPRRRRVQAARAVIDPFIERIISDRRRSGPNEDDLASLLVYARDEDGKAMSDGQLRDEIMTIVATGHDSVTEGLTWAFYLLGRHPEVLRKLEAEVLAVIPHEKPSVETLRRLPYTTMVMQETMRVYPPIWGLMRVAIDRDTIGGHSIPAGANVLMSPYAVQRLPHLWPEPGRFIPERFDPEARASRHRFSWFPFGGGPRQCIGGSFAMLEMPVALAMLVAAFEFELIVTEPVRAIPRVTLKPEHPILVRLRERGAARRAGV
ncbi:MAG: cytochrome P450 [Acidobacteriota bacterium]|nr:cytochrome P450 [Acidobacteriota bacterium]